MHLLDSFDERDIIYCASFVIHSRPKVAARHGNGGRFRIRPSFAILKRQVKSERIDEDEPNNRKPSHSGQHLAATRELTASDTEGSLEHSPLRPRSSASKNANPGTQSSQQHSPGITTPANDSLRLLEDYFAIQLDRDGKPVLLGAGGMGYVMIGKPVVQVSWAPPPPPSDSH